MTQKRSNKKFSLGIAVAVLLPLSFFIIAKLLKKDHINMPRYYVSEKITSKMVDGRMQQDTIFHRITDLHLTNQLGETIGLNSDLKG